MGLQPVNLQNDIGIRPLVVGIVSILFATAAVILRLYSHRVSKTSYALDDILIIMALVGVNVSRRSLLPLAKHRPIGICIW